MDYKETVFLPSTNFPMRGGLPKNEPQMILRWKKINLWKKLREKSKGKKKFILHDGPPYANGPIHIGTALNKILKDIINRTKQMSGFDANYIPGWDCHGLPIEWQVEQNYKKKGINKDEIEIKDFRLECRAFADKWIDVQMDDFKRLFVLGDWDAPYLTMSYEAEAQIVKELIKFIDNGSLYLGLKPVMWSPVEKTALAEAEVEYRDINSTALTVAFKIKESNIDILRDSFVVIWTTTPWTIPANRAIACGKNIEYSLIEIKEDVDSDQIRFGQKILIASCLIKKFLEAINVNKSYIVKNFKGSDLVKTICAHPLASKGYDFEVPILLGDFVSTDQGTGFVHIAPSHGEDDFELGIKYNLPMPEMVEDGGVYTDNVPLFAGIHVFKATDPVIESLKQEESLIFSENYTHSYPHSWRSKKPVIFRATKQWFISMEKNNLREKALKSIENTFWVPAVSKNRIKSMVKERPDWCVSRQRIWGVPITIFVYKESGEILRDKEVNNRIAEVVYKKGADAWFTDNPKTFLGKKYNVNDFIQTKDILDVWFDSGSTHAFVLDGNKSQKWPADLYLEGSDQHRGWFHSSLLESCGTRGRAPFDAVLTHGFVLDGHGRKMSKSSGNVVSPHDIIKQSGADILRLWVAMTDITEDVRISSEVLKGINESYRRLRNTLRFTLGALNNFKTNERLEYKSMPEIEHWVLARLYELNKLLEISVKNYNFQSFYSELHNFCALDLSAFYFDIRKDSLYCDSFSDFKRRASRTVLEQLFICLSSWLAPVLCYTAEEAWLSYKDNDKSSIHLEEFPKISSKFNNEKLLKKWSLLRSIRRVITGALEVARKDRIIGSSLDAKIIIYSKNKDHINLLKEVDLNELSIVSDSSIIKESIPSAAYKEQNIEDIGVLVLRAEGNKCERCWKMETNLKNSICERCSEVIGDL